MRKNESVINKNLSLLKESKLKKDLVKNFGHNSKLKC